MTTGFIFAILVFLGFLFWFLATFPVPYADRISKAFFLAAAFLWLIGRT